MLTIPSSATGQVFPIQVDHNRAEPLLSESIPLFEETGDLAE